MEEKKFPGTPPVNLDPRSRIPWRVGGVPIHPPYTERTLFIIQKIEHPQEQNSAVLHSGKDFTFLGFLWARIHPGWEISSCQVLYIFPCARSSVTNRTD